MTKTKIAVLVSGGGTNLQALIDAQQGGTVLRYLFKSSINSGVIAMVGGLILVPIVSKFTKKQDNKELDEMFACYDEKVEVTAKKSLKN